MLLKNQKAFAKILSCTLLSTVLIACGGGSNEPAPSVDYYYTYTLIKSGMSYESVKNLIGSDANDGTTPGPNRITYRWKTGTSPETSAQLHITLDNQDGVTSKSVWGYKGTQSFYWIKY